MPQYFECKQADIEESYNMVSKNHCLKKSPGRGGEGFHIWPMDYWSLGCKQTDCITAGMSKLVDPKLIY